MGISSLAGGNYHAEAQRAQRILLSWDALRLEGASHGGHGDTEIFFSALSAPLREIYAAGWYLRGSVDSVRDFYAEAQRARRI